MWNRKSCDVLSSDSYLIEHIILSPTALSNRLRFYNRSLAMSVRKPKVCVEQRPVEHDKRDPKLAPPLKHTRYGLSLGGIILLFLL